MLFVVKLSSRSANNAFAYSTTGPKSLLTVALSPFAIQQQESGNHFQVLNCGIHFFVLRTPRLFST